MQSSYSTWKSQPEKGFGGDAPKIKEKQAYLYNFFKIFEITNNQIKSWRSVGVV